MKAGSCGVCVYVFICFIIAVFRPGGARGGVGGGVQACLRKRRMRWGGIRLELGSEWDQTEARGADEGWGGSASGGAAAGDSDVVEPCGKKREEWRNNG